MRVKKMTTNTAQNQKKNLLIILLRPLSSTQPPPNESSLQEQTELFLTSFGDVAPQTALRITNSLADQLFIHAITGVNPTNTFNSKNQTVKLGINTSLTTLEATTDPTTSKNPETDPFTYITTTRYTEEIFYGIVVDTGASQRSTAGYGQV
jgi:hypothetical protein